MKTEKGKGSKGTQSVYLMILNLTRSKEEKNK